MRTLTKEAERKLISAIEKAASFVNEGMSPNAAIIKSAGDANIPSGHINLMVHAYNTGRTTKQREGGDNTLEKAAEFPLADVRVILEALYPENVKTSAELKRTELVSTEYAVPPSGFLNRRRDAMQKAASAGVALPEKTWTPPPRDEHAAVMRAQSEKNAALRAAEETRRLAAAAYQKAANSLEELNTYFRTPGNMPFGDAVREVGLRLGPSGVSVLQKIAAVYPHFTKQADSGKNHYGHDTLYTLVEDVIGTVEHYNEAQSRVATKKADAGFSKKEAPEFITGSILHNPADEPLELKQANVVTIRNNAGQLQQALYNNRVAGPPSPNGLPAQLTPFGDPYDDPRNSKPPEKKDSPKPLELKTDAGAFTAPLKAVGQAMGASSAAEMAGLGPVDAKKEMKKQYDKLYDPEHESALKGIRAKGVLHDLILNDPVISGYDPQDVAMAFNDISELSPALVDAPGMLRAVLRKRLEAGGLADFDVKQLLDMEKVRAERDKLQNETRRIGLDLL
jgi:hypothetical protein